MADDSGQGRGRFTREIIVGSSQARGKINGARMSCDAEDFPQVFRLYERRLTCIRGAMTPSANGRVQKAPGIPRRIGTPRRGRAKMESGAGRPGESRNAQRNNQQRQKPPTARFPASGRIKTAHRWIKVDRIPCPPNEINFTAESSGMVTGGGFRSAQIMETLLLVLQRLTPSLFHEVACWMHRNYLIPL